jgi:hypothetical protein
MIRDVSKGRRSKCRGDARVKGTADCVKTQKLRTSRKLEKECGRNIELMWLLNRLTPDFKTIADFRKDNKTALIGIFKEFSLFCDLKIERNNLINLPSVFNDASSSALKDFTVSIPFKDSTRYDVSCAFCSICS